MHFSIPRLVTYHVGLRFFLVVLAALIAVCPMADVGYSEVKVRGYYRKNGTYVAPHYRSSPDGNFGNNWSTKGNVNPHTGKAGTRVTPPKGYGGSRSSSPYSTDYVISNSHHSPSTSSPQTSARQTDDVIRKSSATDYHGIGFSTTHQHFLRMHPHAQPTKPTDNSGIVCYAIDDIDGNKDEVQFEFFGDELLRLRFIYHSDRIRKGGGVSVFLDKMKKLFGPPEAETEALIEWSFPKSDRSIRVLWVGDYLCISNTQNSVQEKVDKGRFRFKSESVRPMLPEYASKMGIQSGTP